MNEERMAVIADAMFGFMSKRGNEPWTPNSLPAVVAYGIEVALSWRQDEAVRDGWVPPVTEEMVLTGDYRSPGERELEEQLDTVLRYMAIRDGWITANDVDGQVEFRNLAMEVRRIAEMRKILRGKK